MNNSLKIKQLSNKLVAYKAAQQQIRPASGWIKALRNTLNMSQEQLANKLGVTRQSIQRLEKREQEMGISLQSLQEAAHAMDMELVYALVPKDKNLETLIDKKAEQLAKSIVMRTSQTMALEDQQNSGQRILQAIAERKEEIIQQLPKELWD